MIQKQKLLIVDDSPVLLQILTRLLKHDAYELISAVSGDQALQLVREMKPDMVLMDIDMPGMDGFETCRQIKKDPELAEIPVIFISGYATYENRLKSFEVGGQDIISKPVQRDELIAHINTHLTLRTLQQKLKHEIEDKQALIRVLTHDIATPLTVISGQVEMALSNLPGDDHSSLPALMKRLQLIDRSAEQIHEIIEHIGTMEAIKSGKKTLTLEPVSLKLAFQESSALLKDRLKDKNLYLEIIPPLQTLEIAIVAERVSFTSNVLNNLLSNAIKFSYPGSTIQLKVHDNGDEDDVSILLKDQGIGIPQHILNHIFSPTVPTSRRGTAGEKGTGFGMPIVKKYLDLFGGEITIQSKPKEEDLRDHGTEIRLTLKKAKNNMI
ncbi:MAG: hybrid sensor histidine kinase/response regulator [Candidatus Aminicenantes bacterium]|nr:MAG: hybrid sensor histidine kinase/response regulator [Candidatus Aminicenantes bacterium]